ncbi:hypothetical protein [Actinoplanes sp. NPDC026619]|uniref:DUF6928 family protein n=1 Tax=Actinoplanes sp. NPDC026619 TaxID=3155798 RepID=UPI0033C96529
MGAKTALLAFSDGDLREALRGARPADAAAAEGLVREMYPEYEVTPAETSNLFDGVNPPDDVTFALVLPGAELLADWRLVLEPTADLPEELLARGAGRRVVMHHMHSVTDSLCFAVWEDGVLVRSLSLSPDDGIDVNIGEPYEFERPFWAGEHPVLPEPGWPDRPPYPLPFHPLELGEEALRALFGFVLEGRPHPDNVDPFEVPMHAFHTVDPTGAEQTGRDALYEMVRTQMLRPRQFKLGPDGKMHEFEPPN